ncbi:MAG TPA: SDR family NAD(P)-dependent oxidoreductase [Planctomycetota bacterium]|nr:SDR family NAD(P)-dependent oxidoreductase [Planctomycetota bacterium]
MTRTALVTGSNRGIGLGVARTLLAKGLDVVLTARRGADAQATAANLVPRGTARVRAEELDLASETSVAAAAARLGKQGVAVDVLVNNGGVLFEGDVLTTASADFAAAFAVNLFGALWCCRAFVPGMLARGYGRVVNVSSGWGAFAEGLEGPASYAVSKAALNALTVSLARSLRGDVKANACCPGWVRTRMGGAGAELSPEEAADGVVWLATLPADGPNGGFFRAREPIGW